MTKVKAPPVKIRSTGLTEKYASREDGSINYKVIRLVLYGFSTTAIANETGLTYSQVQNRVRMYQLQGVRSMFRLGETEDAKQVMKTALRVTNNKREEDKILYNRIRNSILDAYKKERVKSD